MSQNKSCPPLKLFLLVFCPSNKKSDEHRKLRMVCGRDLGKSGEEDERRARMPHAEFPG